MNKVLIAGNLTKDPEVRVVGSKGMKVCGFTVAVSDKNAEKTTSFIDCDAFAKTAEFIGENYFKGKQILVEGRIKQDSWEKDGKKNSKLCVKVDSVHYIQGDKTTTPAVETTNGQKTETRNQPEYSF